MVEFKPRLTYIVDLPGGQSRLRQMILYVSTQCANAERFGRIKLNKILWKSDFDSFAARLVPVSGRKYQREKLGPIPKDMVPLYRDMLGDKSIRVQEVDFGDNIIEQRTIALITPDMSFFSEEDMRFIESSIRYYWPMTGEEASDDSHGMAWKTRFNGDLMPYESALLSDSEIAPDQMNRFKRMAASEGWKSD